jgi:peptidoglycan DL-endopeptidase CwlO
MSLAAGTFVTTALPDVGSRPRLPRWAITTGLLLTVAGCASGISPARNEAQRTTVTSTSARPIALDRGDETRLRTVDHDPPHATSSAPGGHAVVMAATRYVGAPYLWGGMSPSGFDCSGLVKYVYAKHGIRLPRTVKEQYQIGIPVPRDRLRIGDIVFFDRLRHNGIYVGRDRLIHASSLGGTVTIARLDEEWFRKRWVGARRPRLTSDAIRTTSQSRET